jgi:hypothetical protein
VKSKPKGSVKATIVLTHLTVKKARAVAALLIEWADALEKSRRARTNRLAKIL